MAIPPLNLNFDTALNTSRKSGASVAALPELPAGMGSSGLNLAAIPTWVWLILALAGGAALFKHLRG